VAGAVADILREDGINIVLNATTQRVDSTEDAGVTLTVEIDGSESTITGSHLLVATGRSANTEALNLRVTGIQTTESGCIKVDERLRTTQRGVYAVGDVAGSPAFTHISYDDFRILRTNLIEGGDRTTLDRLVPYTVFIDPQLGRVGLTETEVRKRGKAIKVARLPMNHIARALEVDQSRGWMKVVVDATNDRILGCSVLGMEGGEIMAMLEIAMMGNLPFTALRDGIFAHPTLAEGLNTIFQSLDA
jgi:pyruvate/2-oxoglutarate dehydrogenase complex dihydrolipoamide dehydrogenase (E3) component